MLKVGRASQRDTSAWHLLVSLLVSFGCVQNRSAHTTENGQPGHGPSLASADPSRADLESVLVETPREFESRIHRHDLDVGCARQSSSTGMVRTPAVCRAYSAK